MAGDGANRNSFSGATAVLVFPLVYPGSHLEGPAAETGSVMGLLYRLEDGLADAALALDMFTKARPDYPSFDMREGSAKRERQQRLEAEIAAERGISFRDEGYAEVKGAAEWRLLAEMAASGKLPEGYRRRLQFVHAKSFLYALDSIRKTLLTMSEYPLSEAVAKRAHQALITALPELAGVRDSTAHADERAVGKAYKRPIQPQPILTSQMHIPGGAIVIDCLFNDELTCTLADGSLGRVAIRPQSLQAAQQAIQALLDALPWKEPRDLQVRPSA